MLRGMLAATAIAVLCLGACETGPTPYQRAGGDARGYSEMRIEDHRYRITFRGNASTSRDVVETYMLYRAAELTLQNGFETFTVAHRETDKDVKLHSYGGYYGGYWGYPYYAGGWWGPYWGPYWGGSWGPSYGTSTSYEANIEILMGRAAETGDPDTFDARQVTRNLAGAIQRGLPAQ